MGRLIGQPVTARRLPRDWSRSCCSPRWRSCRRRPRHGQDAAVRQQERAAGHRAHAGRHAARGDRRRARRRSPTKPCATTAVTSVQSYTGHLVAVHVQRTGAALLPAPRAESRRPAGDAGRQGERRPSRATPSPSGCARGSIRSRRGSARGSRSSKCRPVRPCCRPSSPRSMGPIPDRRLAAGEDGAWTRSSRPPASWTWTGMSNHRNPSCGSTSTTTRLPPAGLSAARDRVDGPDGGRRHGGRSAARSRAHARTCRSCCGCRASRRGSLDAVPGLRFGGPGPVAVGELTRAVTTEEAAEHLPQEPAAGDLRHRRRRRQRRESRLRDPPDEQRVGVASRCRRGTALEIFNTRQPFDSSKYAMKWDGEWHITYEVFRDLGIAFAAVLVLIYILVVGWFQSFITPLTIMLAIPFSLVGHSAGARAARRVLHRHVDDRLHRRRGHRRAQLDHPGRLHRAARQGRDAARRGGGRCRRGALQADGADRRGGHRRARP